MKFEFLAHRPEALPRIGRWYYEEWGRQVRGETQEQSIERLQAYLNTDKIPFILVATEGQEILGAAQLKYHEMDMYPEKEHWLGGVFVAPAHRGRGLGAHLAQEIVRHALQHGVSTLYLQTEQLDGGLYGRLGWRPIEQVHHHGVDVLVMERHIGE